MSVVTNITIDTKSQPDASIEFNRWGVACPLPNNIRNKSLTEKAHQHVSFLADRLNSHLDHSPPPKFATKSKTWQ